ncbi:MAG: c-type cytochrome [Bryobacteraceae bacterium]
MRLIVPLLFLVPLLAQQPPAEGAHTGPQHVPKNLQVLKVQPSEIRGIMHSYTVALGQKCTFCHVAGDFASDENHHKIIARKMIVMTDEINSKFPDGKVHVACYTCHRGDEHPKMSPPEGQ